MFLNKNLINVTTNGVLFFYYNNSDDVIDNNYFTLKYCGDVLEEDDIITIINKNNTKEKIFKVVGFNDDAFNLADITPGSGGGGGDVYATYEKREDFPVTGEEQILYVAEDTGAIYYWDGALNQYTNIGGENMIGTYMRFNTLEDAKDWANDESRVDGFERKNILVHIDDEDEDYKGQWEVLPTTVTFNTHLTTLTDKTNVPHFANDTEVGKYLARHKSVQSGYVAIIDNQPALYNPDKIYVFWYPETETTSTTSTTTGSIGIQPEPTAESTFIPEGLHSRVEFLDDITAIQHFSNNTEVFVYLQNNGGEKLAIIDNQPDLYNNNNVYKFWL
jgi:hypothetical protein